MATNKQLLESNLVPKKKQSSEKGMTIFRSFIAFIICLVIYSLFPTSSENKSGVSELNSQIDLQKKYTDSIIEENESLKMKLQEKQNPPETFQDIYFESGDLNPKKNSESEIQKLYVYLTHNKKLEVQLTGYSDADGTLSNNIEISQRRADKVKEILVSLGISSDRINSKGLGSINQIINNNLDKERALNRRVNIQISNIE